MQPSRRRSPSASRDIDRIAVKARLAVLVAGARNIWSVGYISHFHEAQQHLVGIPFCLEVHSLEIEVVVLESNSRLSVGLWQICGL